MTPTGRIIRCYGEELTINGEKRRGFIDCLDVDDGQIHKTRLVPGTANLSRYRLLSDAAELAEGAAVLTGDGRSFVVLRVEPVSIFGRYSHSECVLKLKGGAENA